MNDIKIGVTGIGSLIGQAIIKSIKSSSLNKRIEIIGFDYFEDTIGSYWTEKSFLLPDFLKEDITDKIWLERILDIIKSEDIKIVFPGVDFELALFARYKEHIESEAKCKILVSDSRPIDIANDKYKTFLFLKENGLFYPETWLPEEIDRNKLRFPCFVKPRIGARSRDAFIVKDINELNKRLSDIRDPLIQELVGSHDTEYTCGVVYLDGEIKKSIVLRRKLKEGNTETAYYKKDIPLVIYEYIHKISEKLKPFGACNFQLRMDNNKIPKLFEINARHSGTTYIRALFGFNEVEYILSYILGIEFNEFSLREGIVKRYCEEFFYGD